MASLRRASPATRSTEGLKRADGLAGGRRAPGTFSAGGSAGKRDTEGCDIPASRPPLARGTGSTGGLSGADIPFTAKSPLESSAFPPSVSGIAFYYFQ